MDINNLFLISCDWLQIHVKDKNNFLELEQPYFNIKKTGQSKVFRSIYEIKDTLTGASVAYYCTDANEAILQRGHGILKFDNKQLYVNEDLKAFVITFLERLNFRFIGITRFDIAFDFQKFAGGLNPQTFIHKFMRNEICRVAGGRFGCYGNDRKGLKNFQTLSFGSKTSNINSKLYNKTEELINNKKPWIESRHKETFDKTKNVWRLEFSLFSMTAFLKGEGKDFKFHSLEVLDIVNMYGIFIGLFQKYWKFKKNKGEKRLTRMSNLKLWEFDLACLKIDFEKQNPLIKQSSRSERIFIKKMDILNREFREFDENFNFTAKELISKIINVHSLEDWANDNNIDYNRVEQNKYIDNVYEFTQSNRNEILNNNYDVAMREVANLPGVNVSDFNLRKEYGRAKKYFN